MRVIKADELVPATWKNGGGITREIASHSRRGSVHWRLSIADVDRGGPFSSFPGLSRILTVIEGHGMTLHTPDQNLNALPHQPLAFAGDVPVAGHLNEGPVRNFNLIFDPTRISPTVALHDGPQTFAISQTQHAVHCLSGTIDLNGTLLFPGDTALADCGDVHIHDQSRLICVTL